MIEFRQKEFTDPILSQKDLMNLEDVIVAPLEFMKAVEMMEFNRGAWVSHWAVKGMESVRQFTKNLKLSPQFSLALTVEPVYNNLSKFLDREVLIYWNENFHNPDNFISMVINRLVTQKGKDGIKYDSWLVRYPLRADKETIEKYKVFYKLLALSWSGQITDEDLLDPWNTYYQAYNIPVDYTRVKAKTKPDQLHYLGYLFMGFCGVEETYKPIIKILNYK